MKSEKDPAVFWRENSIYHQNRADFWKKTTRVLAGILTGIVIVTLLVLK